MRDGLASGRVLITGATGGIGIAIARAFAARGAQLVLTGRRAEVLHELAQELEATVHVCDLADHAALAEMIDAVGPVDVLVANAALPASGELASFTAEEIDRMLDVNLRAPLMLTHALVPGMTSRRRGHVVLISSLSGKTAAARSSVYSATKFGLRGFGLALAQDLRDSGVGVSVILPGFVSDAGMFADTGVSLPTGVGTSLPEDVAAAVIDAIQHDRVEVVVAPALIRLGAVLSTLVPGTAAIVQRVAGADEIAAAIADAQSDKRA